jgi:hypothetical protein
MMNIMVLFNWKKMALRRELKTNFILEFPAYRSAFGTQAGSPDWKASGSK